MDVPSEAWLRALNRKFRQQDVAVGERPFLAFLQYCEEFNIQTTFDSNAAQAVFDWFHTNTKPEAHLMTSPFKGVFFYDSCFWPLPISKTYGLINPVHLALRDMPRAVSQDLLDSPDSLNSYVTTWANSVDYAYGFEALQANVSADCVLAHDLISSANHELRSAVFQLLEQPSPKAAMSCRMAVEMFLKAFLVITADLSDTAPNWTEDKLRKKLGHNLSKSINRIRILSPNHEILAIEPLLSKFPDIEDRYRDYELSSSALWNTYEVALHVASSLVRSLTDIDVREKTTKIIEGSL